MLKSCLRKIEAYVPRHIRLGVCASSPDLVLTQDVVEEIPIVDENGFVVRTDSVLKSVPASEAMSKYKCSKFRLSALLKDGVPLNVVNINSSNSVTIDKLARICESLDSAESYVQKVLEQQKERESWFKAPEIED